MSMGLLEEFHTATAPAADRAGTTSAIEGIPAAKPTLAMFGRVAPAA